MCIHSRMSIAAMEAATSPVKMGSCAWLLCTMDTLPPGSLLHATGVQHF